MRHTFFQGAAALLLLAPAPSLAAREVSYGAQAGIAFPAGSFHQNGFKTGGPSLGFHALVDLGGGHALRPRVEWTRNRMEQIGAPVGGLWHRSTATVRTFSLGADYLFHPAGRTEGVYVLAGLSLDAHRFEAATASEANQSWCSASQVRPGLHLGLGWQFNRKVGLELRHGLSPVGDFTYTESGTDRGVPFSRLEKAPSRTFGKTTLSLVVRF